MKRISIFSAFSSVILYLAIASNPATAQSRLAFFDLSYQPNVKECRFIEIGNKLRDTYFNFPAEKSSDKRSCTAKIEADLFNEHFSFCAISSTQTYSTSRYKKCAFTASREDYMFTAGSPGDEAPGVVFCNFVCMTKTDGNASHWPNIKGSVVIATVQRLTLDLIRELEVVRNLIRSAEEICPVQLGVRFRFGTDLPPLSPFA